MSNDIKNQSLDEVAKMMGGSQPNSMADQRARTEFLRRQTVSIQETARATRMYAFYMLISVGLLFISVLGQLVFSCLNYPSK
jgi:hypothetical protein